MGYAQVLTTASKKDAGGGTFADTLAANSQDSLAVANFNTGGARVLEAWGLDSVSLAEFSWVYTRPEATHDQQRGLRVMGPATTFGAIGTRGALNILPGGVVINLFKSDTATISVTSTANDDLCMSWVTEYDDLPGASAVFINPGQLQAMHKSTLGIRVDAVASATEGAYGTSRAFNADDDRLHANTWYAILGWSVQIGCTTVSLIGPDWGGQRIGGPAGILQESSNAWFLDQSLKWNKALIPCFNSNNKGNVLVQVADATASTSPKIDFLLYELTQAPS